MHYDDPETTTPEATTTTRRPSTPMPALPPDLDLTSPSPSSFPEFAFPFERLHAYRLLVEVARWVRAQDWPPYSSDLRDQAFRASASMVLNTAEGCQVGGRQGKNQLRIASGSAAQQHKLRRAGAMIRKLR